MGSKCCTPQTQRLAPHGTFLKTHEVIFFADLKSRIGNQKVLDFELYNVAKMLRIGLFYKTYGLS